MSEVDTLTPAERRDRRSYNVSAAAKLLTSVVALYKRGEKACKVHEMLCNPFVQMSRLLKSVPVTAAAEPLLHFLQ